MAPVKELDVQLNPASLGALTIQMRLNNGSLSVTIQADKSDTLKLIENERGSITNKLQSLNFSVDSLTVKASDAVAPSSSGAGASNTGASNHGQAQQGQSGQTADGSRGGRFSQGAGDQRQSARQDRQGAGDTGGDSNFGHRVI
jgi:flagellar hook-length control protein FliK